METKEWKFVDKSEWTRGEWDNEPDKKQFLDKKTNLPCLIHRGPGGAWCGYVGVDETHPLFKREYSNDKFPGLDVHGGITFTGLCAEKVESNGRGICHVVEPDKKVWWIGFDCAHLGDICPAFENFGRWDFDVWYKNQSYAEQDCLKLAEQLMEYGDR